MTITHPESIRLARTLAKLELQSFIEQSIWSKAEPSEQRQYAKAYRLARECGVKMNRYPSTIRPSEEELRKANEEHEESLKKPLDPEEATLRRAVIEAQQRLGEFCRKRGGCLKICVWVTT
jgi:hypothetical protein